MGGRGASRRRVLGRLAWARCGWRRRCGRNPRGWEAIAEEDAASQRRTGEVNPAWPFLLLGFPMNDVPDSCVG